MEIIPAPWTEVTAIDGTRRILKDAGQEPIVAKKETEGFIICRIQHTITAECFKLIQVCCGIKTKQKHWSLYASL